jgi:hypothetical protein
VHQPPPVSSVDSSLHDNKKQEHDESPMAQVRSYVEKQMDQLQQDLEFGFSRTPKTSSPTPLLTTAAQVLFL